MKLREMRMRPRNLSQWPLLLAMSMLCAVLFPLRAPKVRAQDGEPLAVIIAAAAGISDISLEAVRSAFLGIAVQYKGLRLIPLNLPVHTPARERLDRAVLGLEPTEVGAFWIDQRVRDGRQPPRTVATFELASRVVASFKGAIAAVPMDNVSAQDVRVLRIDGKVPTDPGYPLKSTR